MRSMFLHGGLFFGQRIVHASKIDYTIQLFTSPKSQPSIFHSNHYTKPGVPIGPRDFVKAGSRA
jgi:hypothetical protein